MHENTKRNEAMMETPEFIANVIITVMDDDPAKIIEAQDDANMMIAAGAAFDATRAELMAEYALSVFKRMNENHSFPELKTLTDEDETKVENIIAAHIETKGW
jgi:hypothetical protein